VACPTDLIDRTLSIVNGAGLQPVHLDVGAFALWNTLFAYDRLKIGETIALIDLGSEKMSLYLFKDEILQFSREITPAGDDLTRAITDGIPFERDLIFLHEKAERIKEGVGIPSEHPEEKEIEEPIDLSKISFLMRPVLERWAGEIGRSLDYYRNQFYGERIDRILLTGGGAHLKNFASYLQDELRHPVECFNPLKETLYDVKTIDVGTLDQVGSMFTNAVGVALSEPKQIEFLPVKEPFWYKFQNEKWISIAAFSVTALVFLGIIYHTTSQMTTLDREQAEKMAKVMKLEDLRSKLATLKEKELRMKQDLSLFPSSTITAGPYREVLKEVIKMIPANVTLTHLEVQSGAKALGKTPQASKPQEGELREDWKKVLHLTGLAFGNDIHCLTAIAQIIEGLERSPLFSHVKLISTDENKLYNQLTVEFDIACDIDIPNKGKD
jgi:Tfp pilus assembly protein PilN